MDFHTVTASQVFGVPVESVTPLLRGRAKAVNFGIVYGISAWSLGNDIGVSTAEAKAYMDAYYEKYSGVRDYMNRIIEKAKRTVSWRPSTAEGGLCRNSNPQTLRSALSVSVWP